MRQPLSRTPWLRPRLSRVQPALAVDYATFFGRRMGELMAERRGFEPLVPSRAHLISNQVP
jgi:hypothetical protein